MKCTIETHVANHMDTIYPNCDYDPYHTYQVPGFLRIITRTGHVEFLNKDTVFKIIPLEDVGGPNESSN